MWKQIKIVNKDNTPLHLILRGSRKNDLYIKVDKFLYYK